MKIVQAIRKINAICGALSNVRTRLVLCTTLYRNLMRSRRCLFTSSIPWCKKFKNDQNPNQGSGLKRVSSTADKKERKRRRGPPLCFFFFFFFFYSSQTPVATGRIVGLSGGGARYTRPTWGLGVLMCLVHQEERRERDKTAKRDGWV